MYGTKTSRLGYGSRVTTRLSDTSSETARKRMTPSLPTDSTN